MEKAKDILVWSWNGSDGLILENMSIWWKNWVYIFKNDGKWQFGKLQAHKKLEFFMVGADK